MHEASLNKVLLLDALGLKCAYFGGGEGAVVLKGASKDGPWLGVVDAISGGYPTLKGKAELIVCHDFNLANGKIDSYTFETTQLAIVALSDPVFRSSVLWKRHDELLCEGDYDSAAAIKNSFILDESLMSSVPRAGDDVDWAVLFQFMINSKGAVPVDMDRLAHDVNL